MSFIDTNTLIIGSSISGLACAASLQRQQIEYRIIEKNDEAARPWRNHYERLHLHTSKRCSSLPYRKFEKTIPRYPSRQQVVDYLDEYRRAFDIQPIFNTEALAVRRTDGQWVTETNDGTFRSDYLIMATGAYGSPRTIRFKGMEGFPGRILHSAEYKTGRDFKGQKVLVVGFGNSACEIAIDLYEQGAIPYMSVRSPVNVIPRDIFGIPVLEISIVLSLLPPRVADLLSAPLIRLLIGNLEKLGLQKMPYGPLEEISRRGKVPLLDIGTIRHIREGHIRILGDISHIEGDRIQFAPGNVESFDAIVAGIGYSTDDLKIIDMERARLNDLRLPATRQQFFGKDGLYFCGYSISPTGQIREIASDAIRIAKDIAGKHKHIRAGN